MAEGSAPDKDFPAEQRQTCQTTAPRVPPRHLHAYPAMNLLHAVVLHIMT